MHDLIRQQTLERALWMRIRHEFAEHIQDLPDTEFTKTFFSSVTRR